MTSSQSLAIPAHKQDFQKTAKTSILDEFRYEGGTDQRREFSYKGTKDRPFVTAMFVEAAIAHGAKKIGYDTETKRYSISYDCS